METSHRNLKNQYRYIVFKNGTQEFAQNAAEKEKRFNMKKQLTGMKDILSLSSKFLLRGSKQKDRTNGQEIFHLPES